MAEEYEEVLIENKGNPFRDKKKISIWDLLKDPVRLKRALIGFFMLFIVMIFIIQFIKSILS